MADRQGLPSLLHAFECIGSISHHLDQGIVFRLEKPLLEYCRASEFDLEEYIARRSAMKAKIRE